MALQFAYSLKGIDNPDAYAKIAQINLDYVNKTGQVTFNIYHDRAARTADPIGNVIGQKSYTISRALFEAYFSPDVLDGVDVNALAQAYELAKNTKEGPEPQAGQADSRVSYFSQAIDV